MRTLDSADKQLQMLTEIQGLSKELEQLKQQLGDRLRIIKIDVDKNQAVAAQYQVQAVPTLMLFRGGRLLWRQSGAVPLQQLMGIVESYV